jgi:hypothetical protein
VGGLPTAGRAEEEGEDVSSPLVGGGALSAARAAAATERAEELTVEATVLFREKRFAKAKSIYLEVRAMGGCGCA